MKLEEAITDLSLQMEVKRRLGKSREADAVKLGIEALKRVQDMRISPCTTEDELLPGETQDPHA